MPEPLIDLVNSLTDEQQASVREFVQFLKQRNSSQFLSAVDEFIDQHPELLRRLAQ